MNPIEIHMLGEFSLQSGENQISDSGKRSRKMWCLLAYFICGRKRFITPQKLIDLLYGDGPDSNNPENALRITMHRMRQELDKLWPGAGKELILYRDGGYGWNPDSTVTLDYDRFDELSASRTEDPGQRLQELLEALSLYRGEFLPRHKEEEWVMPIATHFHNRFVEMTLEAAGLLIAQDQYAQAAALCRRAVQEEPYHEPLHQMLMQALGGTGDSKGIATVYENLRKRLFDDFGIHPSEQTRELYRKLAHGPDNRPLPVEEVLEHLREPDGELGAMVCDYDYFKILCYMHGRAVARSGQSAHVVLLSISGSVGQELTKRSQNRVMELLGEHFRQNLRRSDVISRCSAGQYILMLTNATHESAELVLRRVLAAFHHCHPRMAVEIHYVIRSLTEDISVP